jgi:hypothetical protein
MSDFDKLFRKSKITTSKGVTPGMWLTNAGRSLGMSAFDVISEVLPATSEFAKVSKESVSDLRKTVLTANRDKSQLKSAFDTNDLVKVGNAIFKNSLEDLKTGNFYNKKRNDDYNKENDPFADFNMEDFDMGEDDDNFDFEASDGDATAKLTRASKGKTEVTNISMVNNLGEDSPLVQATNNHTKVTLQSTKHLSDLSTHNSKLINLTVSKLGSQLNSQLATMNDNVSVISSTVTSTLSEHASLSAKYYDDSMTVYNSILDELKAIRSSNAKGSGSTAPDSREYDDVLSLFSNGIMNPKDYGKLVKKQFGQYTDGNFLLSSIKFAASQTDSLMASAMSPLKVIPKMLIGKFIPEFTKAAAKSFDDQLKETMAAGLVQIRGLSKSSNPLLSALGEIFGIKNNKTYIDKGNYEKGPVAWDGISYKTLNDVIPTYLRQIAAAVTHTEEKVFDYKKGEYRSLKDVQKDFNDDEQRSILSSQSEALYDFKDYMDKLVFNSKQQQEELFKTFEKYLVSLGSDPSGRNFRNIEDIIELSGGTSQQAEAIQGYHKQLPNAKNSRIYGSNALYSNASHARFIADAEKNPSMTNSQYMKNGMGNTTKYDSMGNVSSSGFVDKYNRDSLYYLRNILTTLNTGIYVQSVSSLPTGGKIDSEISKYRSKILSGLDEEKTSYDKAEVSKYISDRGYYSEDEIASQLGKGKFEYSELRSKGAGKSVGTQLAAEQRTTHKQSQTLAEKLLLTLGLKEDSNLAKMFGKFNGATNATGRGLANGFEFLDNALFKLVFGSDDDQKGTKGLFQSMTHGLQLQLFKFGKFLDEKVISRLDESLFGEKGFITNLKKSEMYGKVKDRFNDTKTKASAFILGRPDGSGKRSGGIFSETFNELSSMGMNLKTFIFGDKKNPEKDSIAGSIKEMFNSTTTSIKGALGIDNDKEKKPLSSFVKDTAKDLNTHFKMRFDQWSDMLFGDTDKSGKYTDSAKEIFSTFKEDMHGQSGRLGASAVMGGVGATVLSGHLGLLGSMFLPGGPIGGALLGLGIGVLSKSTQMQAMLFGEKDLNGQRIGGLITKDVQDFFKENKTGISIGALGGLASSFGLLPSLFLPGGPIGGALLGGALSLASKSGMFTEILYGKDGDKDNVTGGITKFIKDHYKKNGDAKTTFLDAGIGAGVGIMGSFFLPGGPITGALIGSATSIAINSDKFKTLMFGEEDPDTHKRKGGLYGKFTGFLDKKIFSPLSDTVKTAQNNMLKFVEKTMVNPMLAAMDPIMANFKRAGESVKSVFADMKAKFDNRVMKPIGDTVDKYIISPMKKTLTKIFGGIGKILGSLISAPFQAVFGVGLGLQAGDKKRGLKTEKDKVRQNMFNKENGVLGNLKNIIPYLSQVTNKDFRKGAMFGENGAYYGDINDKLADLNTKTDAKYKNRGLGTYDNSDNKRLRQSRVVGRSLSRSELRQHNDRQKMYDNLFSGSFDNGDTTTTSVGGVVAISSPITKQTETISTNHTESMKIMNNIGHMLSDIRQTVAGGRKSTTVGNVGSAVDGLGELDDDNTSISSRSGFNASASRPTRSKTTVSKKIGNIDKNISDINDSTYGQLNGVGSNINKILKLLLRHSGMSDEDVEGANNKEHQGFLGKLRTQLNRPFNAIIKMATTPFKKLKDFGNLVLTTTTTTVKKTIKGIADGAKMFISGVLEVPKLLLGIIGDTVKSIGPAVGEVAVTLVKGVSIGIETAGNVLIQGINTVGTVVTEAGKGLGTLIGGVLGGIGNFALSTGLLAKEVAPIIGKTIANGFKFVGKGVGAVLSAPFKLVGGLFENRKGGSGGFGSGKGPVHVIVDSGELTNLVGFGETSKFISALEKIEFAILHGSPLDGYGPKFKNATRFTYNKPDSFNSDDTLSSVKMPMNLQFFGKNSSNGMRSDFTKATSKAEELEELQTRVSNNSAESLNAKFDAQDKAKEDSKFKAKLLGLFQKNNDTQKKHTSLWSSLFSKNGLIGAALIAAIPLIPSILKILGKIGSIVGDWFGTALGDVADGASMSGGISGIVKNAGEQTKSVTDLLGTTKGTKYKIGENGELLTDENGNLIKEEIGGGLGNRISEFYTPTKTRIDTQTGEAYNAKTWDGITDSKLNTTRILAGKGIRKATNVINGVKTTGTTMKKAGSVVSSGMTKILGAGNTTLGTSVYTHGSDAIKGAKTAVGVTKTKLNTGVDKILKISQDAISTLITKFDDLLKKHGLASKVTGNSAVTGLLSKLKSGVLNTTILGKFAGKFAGAMGKLATAAGTLLTSEVVWGVTGAIAGACNAANLFQVSSDAIDWKMRAISAVFRGLLSTSIGGFIDIIDSIASEILGFSFVTELSILVYNLLSDEEDKNALTSARDQFKQDYTDYVEDEYTTYAKKQQDSGQAVMSMDDFKKSDIATSYNEYNAERNKSLGKKIWDGVSDTGRGIAHAGKTVVGGIGNAGKTVINGAKDLGTTISTGISNAKTGLKNAYDNSALKKVIDSISGIGTFVGTTASGIIKTAWTGDNANLVTIDENDPLSEVKKMMAIGLNMSMLPVKLTVKGSRAIYDGVKTVWDKATVLGSIVKTSATNRLKSAWSGETYKSAISQDNEFSNIASTIDMATGIALTPITGTLSAIRAVKDGISAVVQGASVMGSMISTSATGRVASALSGEDYTMIPVGEPGSVVSTVASTIDTITGVMLSPLTGTISAVRFVKEKLSGVFSGVADFATDIASYANVFDNKTTLSNYLENPNAGDSGIFGGIKSLLFYAIRSGLAMPFLMSKGVSTLVDTVKKKVGGVVNGVADFVGLGNAFNTTGGKGSDNSNISSSGKGQNVNGFTYYSQNDPSIRNQQYNQSNGSPDTMGARGCGPTAMSMVASQLTGQKYDPVTMANVAEKGGYSTDVGTTPNYFSEVGNSLGLGVNQYNANPDSIRSVLKSGQPVILQGQSNSDTDSPYTKSGHYVVGVGLDSNGGVMVNDPRGTQYSKSYSMDKVTNGVGAMWGFGNGGFGLGRKRSSKSLKGGFGAATSQQQAVLNAMFAIEGKLKYSQKSNERNLVEQGLTGTGYGDCSSTVQWVLKHALGIDPGGDTRSQISSSRGTDVDTNAGGSPNVDNLQPGDLLFFGSSTDPSSVGHVEMYIGDGKIMGHGGGSDGTKMGPTRKDLSSYIASNGKKYIKARRYFGDTTAIANASTTSTGTSATTDSTTTPSTSGGSTISSIGGVLSGLASAALTGIGNFLSGNKTSTDSSSSTTGTSTATGGTSSSVTAGSVDTGETAKRLYNFLRGKGMSAYGASALMGNIFAESGMKTNNLQNSFEGRLGSDTDYTSKVDGGTYANFANDSAGYGLAQWTSAGRKLELYNLAKSRGKSISDPDVQMEHLWNELSSKYPAVKNALMNASDIQTASNIVLKDFESPKDQSSAVQTRRASYGQGYYQTYANASSTPQTTNVATANRMAGGFGNKHSTGISNNIHRPLSGGRGDVSNTTISSTVPQSSISSMAQDFINSSGLPKSSGVNSSDSPAIQIIKLLQQLVSEAQGTNSGIDKLNNKDFGSSLNMVNNSGAPSTTINSTQGSSVPAGYSTAKQIASGILTT